MQKFYDAFFNVFPYFYEAPLAYVLVFMILTTSLIGFHNKTFYNALIFHPYEVFKGKRIHTLLTSILIHRNWKHLLWNLVVIFGLTYDFIDILQQEYLASYSYFLYATLTITSVLLANIIVGLKQRQKFEFTSVGSSGLSYALVGATIMFYPLQKMSDSFLIRMELAYQYWILLFIIFVLLAFRKSKVNHILHLYSFLLASLYILLLRPLVLHQIINHLMGN